MDYYKKYRKYKNKYLELKQDAGQREKGVDLDLFFDLLQAAVTIINKTVESDIIILIGETPAYLKPILEKERKVINLALSNKAFGCFLNGYNLPYDMNEEFDKKKQELFQEYKETDYYKNSSDEDIWKVVESQNMAIHRIPSLENYETYTNYLNEKTELTKKLVKEWWDDIVLIDFSSGPSIAGASNFLNRYAGHIDYRKPCHQIDGAKPLRFIQLFHRPYINFTNLDPVQNKEIIGEKFLNNYNPKLLIFVALVAFKKLPEFTASKYPRYVPFHPPTWWNEKPGEPYEGSLENLDTISKLLDYYHSYKDTCIKLEREDKNRLIKFAKYISDLPNLDKEASDLISSINQDLSQKEVCTKLSLLFTKINNNLILQKYNVLKEYQSWEDKDF